jgi:hypothetical protein
MSLFSISPSDVLTFDLSPSSSKTQLLHLTNTSPSEIAYKVRTTASKSYLVKPNQGYLKPNESVPISIALQVSETQPDTKHKFLIQATLAQHCEDFSQWPSIPKEKIFDSRLDVVLGNNKVKSPETPRASAIFSEIKVQQEDEMSTEEANSAIKKLEAEKSQLEMKLGQVNAELRNKEILPRKGDVVRFKRNILILFGIGGIIFGYMSS